MATLCQELQYIFTCDEATILAEKVKVDNFIKAFYYDREKDLLEWIGSGNAKFYEIWHLQNLLQFGIGETKSGLTITEKLNAFNECIQCKKK